MTTERVMMIGGVVVLFVLLGLIVFCVMKRRPYKGLLTLLPLAVIMIGFSSISSFKIAGAEVVIRDTGNNFKEHPENPQARKDFDDALDNAMSQKESVSPQTHSNLVAVVDHLSRQPSLSAESRLTLSKAELFLGRTNSAANNVKIALKANTNLTISPRMRALVRPP